MNKSLTSKILIKSYINKDRDILADTATRILDCTPKDVLSLLDYLTSYSVRLNNYTRKHD